MSIGTLYVCASPIGNYKDTSQRLIDTIESVDHVAAEDTRVTGLLLQHIGIKRPLIRVEKHNEAKQISHVLSLLNNGESIALLSDAGTPAISDPGSYLVQNCVEAGVRIVPIPGPSAVTAVLSVAGVPADAFHFLGFLPKKDAERETLFKTWPSVPTVYFETGKRIESSLAAAHQQLDISRLVIAKELTKDYETIWYSYEEWQKDISADPAKLKGEWVLLIQGRPKTSDSSSLDWAKELLDAGFSQKQILLIGQKYHGYKRNELYALLNEL